MADAPVNLFSTRAHVFQINPETKASWLPKGDSAIPISFIAFGPANERELKIIGTNDNGEPVLDCIILPKTVFNKRSQKFGQWHDHTGMIYGLGFNSEIELNEFMDTFRQLQQDLNVIPNDTSPRSGSAPTTNTQQSQFQQNLTSNLLSDKNGVLGGNWNKAQQQHQQQQQQQQPHNVTANNSSSEINDRDQSTTISNKSGTDPAVFAGQYPNTLSHPSRMQQHQQRRQPISNESQEHDANNNNGMNNGTRYPRSQSMFGMQQQQQQQQYQYQQEQQPKLSSGRMSPESDFSQSDLQLKEQLKYENDKLKQALEESSKNAGIWQNELINLRTNNAKLTQALQESKAHVEEWEKELLGLRDENKDLKLRVMTLESGSERGKSDELKLELQKYKDYTEDLQGELKKKDTELDQVQKSMEELEIRANSKEGQNGRSDDPTSVEVAISSYQKQRLDSITSKLNSAVDELDNIRKEYAQFSEKLYH